MSQIYEKFKHLVKARTVNPRHFISSSSHFLWEDGRLRKHLDLPRDLQRKIEATGQEYEQKFITDEDIILDLERRISKLEQQEKGRAT